MLLWLLVVGIAAGAGGSTSLVDRYRLAKSRARLTRQQQQQQQQQTAGAAQPPPVMLPREPLPVPVLRGGLAPADAAPLGTPPPGTNWLTITDFNVSTTGTQDVSTIIDEIGRLHSHGVTLYFPGGLGPGGTAAGSPPSLYLIDPPAPAGPAGSWTAPTGVTIWMDAAATLVSGQGVRVFLAGPIRANAYQIFSCERHPLPCVISSNGTNATVTVSVGRGLQVGDRFQVSGAAQPEFNGFYSVFSASGKSFSFEMATPPEASSPYATAGGHPVITFAGFYFGSPEAGRVMGTDGYSGVDQLFSACLQAAF